MGELVVIVAAADDTVAHSTACNWSARADVRVLTPADLFGYGWRHDPADPASGSFVAGGEVLNVSSLRAVYTRLGAVRERDVPHVRTADRDYVAQEMHAFLVAWLSALPCPVTNAATPSCLAGPAWPWERWALAAHRAGLRPDRVRRTTARHDKGELRWGSSLMHVLGDRCLGEHLDIRTQSGLIAMASEANAVAVSVLMSPPDENGESDVLDCSPWLNLSDRDVQNALLDLLLGQVAQ
jgi:hypothetical protein